MGHDPARGRDVGEAQRARAVCGNLQIVAKQVAVEGPHGLGFRRAERLLPQHLILDDEDVEVAVVVVVEQSNAGRHDLRVIELAGHAVEVGEVEASLFRAIREPAVSN